MEANLSFNAPPLTVHEIMRQLHEESVQADKEPIVTVVNVVTTTSRHGKYKDPEARKAYQRDHMAAKREKSVK